MVTMSRILLVSSDGLLTDSILHLPINPGQDNFPPFWILTTLLLGIFRQSLLPVDLARFFVRNDLHFPAGLRLAPPGTALRKFFMFNSALAEATPAGSFIARRNTACLWHRALARRRYRRFAFVAGSCKNPNNDGVTDENDLQCVLQNFGHNCLINGPGKQCN
jgi:hypothetical protein